MAPLKIPSACSCQTGRSDAIAVRDERGHNKSRHQALDVTGLGCVSDNGSRGSTLCTASAIVHLSKNRCSLHTWTDCSFIASTLGSIFIVLGAVLRDTTQWWADLKVRRKGWNLAAGGQNMRRDMYVARDILCFAWDLCPRFCQGEKKNNNQQPNNVPTSPVRILTSAVFETFFFSFPFTHSHIYKPVTMNAWISSRAFQNKTLNSTRVYVIAFIFERGFAQLPANGRLVSSLAWRRAPTPPSSSSPPLNAEFGARKALSAADNGGSGCCGRTGRCNFSRLLYQRPHLPFKLLRGVERASLWLHAHLLFFFLVSTSAALERGPTAAPRLRQFWVHLQITPLTTPRVHTHTQRKRDVFLVNHTLPVLCFFYLHLLIC